MFLNFLYKIRDIFIVGYYLWFFLEIKVREDIIFLVNILGKK